MSSPTGATGAPSHRILAEDEDELELPPLDGAPDERAAEAAVDDDDVLEEEGGAGDDGAAAELDPGFSLDVTEEAPVSEEAARDAVDIGAMDDAIAFLDEDARSSDESGLTHDAEDESILDAQESDDVGAGTGEDPSVFVDEGALPPLDADEGADEDEAAARGEGTGIAPSRGASAAPERGGWRVASSMGAQVPCWLVAVSPAHVVAAGPTVLIARDGGRVSKTAGPDIDAVALAAAEEAIFAVARKGALVASVDGGDSWATGSVPWHAAHGGLAIAATPGRLWICEGGALWSVRWSRRSRPEPPVLARKRGVRAMVAAGSTLVVLSERAAEPAAPERGPASGGAPEHAPASEGTLEPAAEGPLERSPASEPEGAPESAPAPQRAADLVLERLRGDDEVPDAQVVPQATRAAIADAQVVLASTASGRALALLAGGAVHVSRDGGATFQRCRLAPAVAIGFAGDGDDARVVALTTNEERARSSDLILVEAGEGSSTRIADIATAGASGRAALVWDASREVLWVASSAGLVAFERSARH